MTKKIKIGDLENIRRKIRRTSRRRLNSARAKITVHMGTCGIAAGSRDIMTALTEEIQTRGINDVILTPSGCAGLCSREPMVTIEISGEPPLKYVNLTDEKVRKIFNRHVLEGKVVKQYALAIGSERTH